MTTIRCSNCSFLSFATADVCKRCGSPLNSRADNLSQTQPSTPSETSSGQSSFPIHMQAGGFQPYFYDSPVRRDAPKGKTIGVILLALISLVVLIGIPIYLKHSGGSNLASLQWRDYKFADGSYSILMPGEPLHSSDSLPSPAGTVKIEIAHVEVNRGTSKESTFGVLFMEYPNPTSNVTNEQLFDKALESLAHRSGLSVLNSKKITLDGYQGLEVEVKPPASAHKDGDKGVFRIYSIPPRVYMIGVGGPDSPEAAAARIKFLDSFKPNQNH